MAFCTKLDHFPKRTLLKHSVCVCEREIRICETMLLSSMAAINDHMEDRCNQMMSFRIFFNCTMQVVTTARNSFRKRCSALPKHALARVD